MDLEDGPGVRPPARRAWRAAAARAVACARAGDVSDAGGVGTDSDVISEAQARRMVQTLPQGELVVVPGIGHAPTLVEPAVLTALERFLPIAASRA